MTIINLIIFLKMFLYLKLKTQKIMENGVTDILRMKMMNWI